MAASCRRRVHERSVHGCIRLLVPRIYHAAIGYFAQLGKFLTRERKKGKYQRLLSLYPGELMCKLGKVIYPPREQIFRAFELSSWESTRVVIIGQE